MSATWESTLTLNASQRLEVLHLINQMESELGREALDETRRRAVVHGGPAEHGLRRNNGALVQYACLQGTDHPTIEMCGGGVDEQLLTDLLARHSSVDWWTRDSDGRYTNVVRTLQLLSMALPVPVLELPETMSVRVFDPERDACAWLEQNNAAFADHPEQGAWRLEDLHARIAEPWFDPSGFLLLCEGETITASCWTKVHELYAERFGEIYVLSVNPAFQGRGLGRIMLNQGLVALRRKGVSRAVLFVDEDNAPALSLYQSYGFTLGRKDQLLHFGN